MKISDIELYRVLLQKNSGAALTPEKSYVLDSRLTPICRKYGYPTLEAMTLTMRGIPPLELIEDVVEAMASCETSFFHDNNVIDSVVSIFIPHMIKENGKRNSIRIWSAGCSSGQEPYSIAMAMKENEQSLKSCRFEFIATDLSVNCLQKAKNAIYSQFDVQRGLPIRLLLKYFEEIGDAWRLDMDVKHMVRFERFNLLNPMDELGLFNVIFCCNVLNGMAPEAKATVCTRLANQLASNGILVLGQTEKLEDNLPLKSLDGHPGIFLLKNGNYNLHAIEQAFIKYNLKTSVSANNSRKVVRDI